MREAYSLHVDIPILQQLDKLFQQFLQRKPDGPDIKRYGARVFAERWRTLQDLVIFVSDTRRNFLRDECWTNLLSEWACSVQVKCSYSQIITSDLLEEEDTEEYEHLRRLLEHLKREIGTSPTWLDHTSEGKKERDNSIATTQAVRKFEGRKRGRVRFWLLHGFLTKRSRMGESTLTDAV